jgi:hypothetical protein
LHPGNANAAGRRVALVIGNGAYQASPLKNPVHDARDMAGTLKRLGFDVTLLTDAGQRDMEEAVHTFGTRLGTGVAGLFYYAGHGMQVRGDNYLIPVDADVRSESDIRYEAVNAGRVLGKMQDAGNGVNIVILDACRNNPFARSFRSDSRGLARMDAPAGSIVAFATAPGSVAADGHGDNGLYTHHLLRHIETQGLTINDVLMRTRIDVAKESEGQQVPWESSSLMGYFTFKPTAQGQAPTPAPTTEAAQAQQPAPKPVQTAALAPPPVSEPDPEIDRSPTMAVLPFYLGRFERDLNGRETDKREELVDAVVSEFLKAGFKPIATGYDTDLLRDTPPLMASVNEKALFRLDGRSYTVDKDYCRALGKRLGVDVVLTAVLATSKAMGNNRGVTPILVDVATGDVYEEKATFYFSTGKYWQGMENVPPVARKVLAAFERSRS